MLHKNASNFNFYTNVSLVCTAPLVLFVWPCFVQRGIKQRRIFAWTSATPRASVEQQLRRTRQSCEVSSPEQSCCRCRCFILNQPTFCCPACCAYDMHVKQAVVVPSYSGRCPDDSMSARFDAPHTIRPMPDEADCFFYLLSFYTWLAHCLGCWRTAA